MARQACACPCSTFAHASLLCTHNDIDRVLQLGVRTGQANLPGQRKATIQQFALVWSSSSLHSEACNAIGASDGVIHSTISAEAKCSRALAYI